LEDISNVRDLPKLKILNMGQNFRMKINASTFSNNLEMSRLYLSNTNLDQILNFDFLKNMQELVYLNVMENQLDDKIESLPALPKLARLVLRKCELKTLDFQQIKKKFPTLSQINLTENQFGCLFLQDMLKFFAENNISLDYFYSKPIPGFESINDVQCINNSIVNIEYVNLIKRNQQLQKELSNANKSIENIDDLKIQKQKLRKELEILYSKATVVHSDDLKIQNQKLRNNLRFIAIGLAGVILSVWACIFICRRVCSRKETMSGNIYEDSNSNIYDEITNETTTNIQTPNTDNIIDKIKDESYAQLTWATERKSRTSKSVVIGNDI
jgi:hypothetical protein